MFNLSDKELDRLSREAASAYDPGEPAGAGSWDMLKLNLDKELGKAAPNPLHAIRRIPFYYAPVIVLLAGVSYYFIRHGKNNSRAAPTPASPVNPQQFTQNNSNKPNSTPFNEHTTDKTGPGATAANTPAPANAGAPTGPAASTPPGVNTPSGSGVPASAGNPAAANTPSTSGNPAAATTRTGSITPGGAGNPSKAGAPSGTVSVPHSGSAPGPHSGAATGLATASGASNAHSGTRPGSDAGTIPGSPTSGSASSGIAATTNGKAHHPGHAHPSASDLAGQPGVAGQPVQQSTTHHPGRHHLTNHSGQDLAVTQIPQQVTSDQAPGGTTASQNGQQTIPGQPGPTGEDQRADLARTVVRKPYSLGKAPAINDSALRKLTAKTAVNNAALINVGKKNNQSLHVDRSLQLGFTIAPDFASVHSLAGDKPGSITGITLDYEFVNRWYIGTGLLYSRRNYTARSEDYHVPPYYYQMNNMHDVNYIRGSFHMLEIPINLRYDFSLAGNTVFFASAGVSSYLHSNESCSYYYSFFGREAYRKFSYPVQHAPIFSVINLSMGIEAGISNSFSFLVAPYMKLPTNTIGFGKIDMNSIGVNFGVKYSPVLRRTRK